jgi:hypothetical protein
MRKLNIAATLLVSLGLVTQRTAWASWAQVDHATRDEVLRRITDEGSSMFLSGAIKVQEAFRKFDDGDREGAIDIGLKAVDDFDRARARFEAASDRVKDRGDVAEELNARLRQPMYEKRAAELGLSPSDSARLRLPDQHLAVDADAVGLFGSAARRASSLRDKSLRTFRAIKDGTYSPLQGASLLAEMGEALMFGASVSAAFSK